MTELTLTSYQEHERRMARSDARRGFRAHAVVTVVVILGLVALNVFVASEFPWAIFPAIGMTIGLFAHWYFGVKLGEQLIRRHQHEVEQEARQLAA